MKLLIPSVLLAFAANCEAQKLLRAISNPVDVVINSKNPTNNVNGESGFAASGRSGGSPKGEADPMKSSNSNEVAENGGNRLGDVLVGAVRSPIGAATNIGKAISDNVENFLNKPVDSFASALGGGSGSVSRADSNGASDSGAVVDPTKEVVAIVPEKIREMFGGVIDSASGIASNIRDDFNSLFESGASQDRESGDGLPESLKNSTGSVREAVEKLELAIRRGSSMDILSAAASASFEIFVQMSNGQIEASDGMRKLSDLGTIAYRGWLQSLSKGASNAFIQGLMPGRGAGVSNWFRPSFSSLRLW